MENDFKELQRSFAKNRKEKKNLSELKYKRDREIVLNNILKNMELREAKMQVIYL